MSFSLCIIAIMFNFFMLELLIREKIEHINQNNAPGGIGMSALIVAYNITDNPIPRSTVKCHNKLECLQLMCQMENMPQCNTIKIWPMPSTWSNKCNLTVIDSIRDFYQQWSVVYIVSFVISLVALLSAFIGWVLYLSTNWKYLSMILVTSYMTYMMSSMIITVLSIETLADISTKIEYEIIGMNYFNKIHNIILLGMYLFMVILFLVNLFTTKYRPSPIDDSELISGSDL